jgi:hypothetical protein
LTNSNFVTQDQRIEDLEDIAYLKKRVFELEETVARLESIIRKNMGHKKHREQIMTPIGFVPIERDPVKISDDFLEPIGE